MPDFSKLFYLLGVVFLLMGLLFNINPHWPRIPGDIYVDKPGIKIYIPVVSSLIISAILTILLNFFRK